MKFIDLTTSENIIEKVRETTLRHNDKLDKVLNSVKEILLDVKENKDEALRKYALMFDKASISDFRVSEEEINSAYEGISKEMLDILIEAKNNIERYHRLQHFSNINIEETGKFLSQKVTAIERVGLYIPGGKSPYPSTVLMNAIPAKVAGVKEIAIATPANSEGKINPHILAAAKLCGVNEIYKIGGAQAIGAFAYGTQSIKKVYKICGPGNLYVAAAKKEVYGDVAIDMIAGPSEILIIADENSNPRFIAADLLSQAEHDENAACVLVCTCKEVIDKTLIEIEKQVKELGKEEIARKALDNFAFSFLVSSIKEAFMVSNEIAPEHLEILLTNPREYVDLVQNAGTVFLGQYTPEPVGDYFAGSNHTIPTSGKAKFYSPLSTYDFLKRTSIVYYEKDELEKSKDKIINFANTEGLTAHANAVKRRFENE